MNRIARLAIVLFIALACLAGERPQPNIHGQVTDPEGAVIAKARVLVHWDSSGSDTGLRDNIGLKGDVTITTDANGSYSVSVPPGFYDLFITSASFTPVAAKVRVKEQEGAIFNATLPPDPLICKELCDAIAQPAQR